MSSRQGSVGSTTERYHNRQDKQLRIYEAKIKLIMQGYKSLMMPFGNKPNFSRAKCEDSSRRSVLATSAEKKYDLAYYLKGALAGGICCSVTHGALWYLTCFYFIFLLIFFFSIYLV